MRAKKEAFDSKRRDDVDVEAKVVTVSQPSQVSSGGGTSLRLQPRLAHQLGDLFSVLDSTRHETSTQSQHVPFNHSRTQLISEELDVDISMNEPRPNGQRVAL